MPNRSKQSKIAQSKIAEAYKRAKPVHNELHRVGRCMEITEDEKYGIVWELWLVGRSQVAVYATPNYTEIFSPITSGMTWEGTIDAITKLAIVEE